LLRSDKGGIMAARSKKASVPAKRGKRGGAPAAIVTGGASGIGLACVERLLEAGWQVGLLDRDEKALARMRKRYGRNPRVRIAAADVTDEAAIEAIVGDIANAFGRLDGLVNSAGIGADVHVFDTTVELFRRVLDINLTGTFIVGRAAARIMRDGNGGSIVNIASISGLRGGKGRAAYGSSKGGVVNLTQVMAVDLARFGIRVNAVAPGPVDTPMVRALHGEGERFRYLERIPMRRYAQPEEISGAVLFLLDPALSSFVTGEIIAVDGGFRGAGLMELKD
jgi:NAD(P)-dependent dehydrogenase (short-subunit alcohol dehydrogenase family)